MKVLSGDIGGTNTRLVIANIEHSEISFLHEKGYKSNQYHSLQQVINTFLDEVNYHDQLHAACFSVAGPVKSGTSKITNLPWSLSEQQLAKEFNIPKVKLMNDFMAVAYGISELSEEDILVIQKGSDSKDKSEHPDAAIIGAGTGLGASHRVWLNNQYYIFPSETGHVGFTPENDLQSRLLVWLQEKYPHVSLEMVLSGRGLCTIYQYLQEKEQYPESELVKEAMNNNDPAQVITEQAIKESDELCLRTVECFTEIYGATAGNVALQYYPVEELYIAGGIASKIKEMISSRLFIDAFTNKGLMTSNMKEIAIKLVLNEKVGLLGALSQLNV